MASRDIIMAREVIKTAVKANDISIRLSGYLAPALAPIYGARNRIRAKWSSSQPALSQAQVRSTKDFTGHAVRLAFISIAISRTIPTVLGLKRFAYCMPENRKTE